MPASNTTPPLVSALYQACDCLNMYQAELARILRVNCQDVSTPQTLKHQLQTNADVILKAERFLVFFQLLEDNFDGQSEKYMVHWFRKKNPTLGTSPLLALVDEGRLEDLINLIGKKPQESAPFITPD